MADLLYNEASIPEMLLKVNFGQAAKWSEPAIITICSPFTISNSTTLLVNKLSGILLTVDMAKQLALPAVFQLFLSAQTQRRMLRCLLLLIILPKCLSSQGRCPLKCDLTFTCILFPRGAPLIHICLASCFVYWVYFMRECLFPIPYPHENFTLFVWHCPIISCNIF